MRDKKNQNKYTPDKFFYAEFFLDAKPMRSYLRILHSRFLRFTSIELYISVYLCVWTKFLAGGK